MYRMKGIIPAMVTPFKNDYSINRKAMEELIDFLIHHGVHCILVGGSTGEYTLMTDEERKLVIELTVKLVDGRVPVMAGTGYHSTKETIELTKYAQEVGAESALLITPHYLKPSDEGLITHFKTVAESVSIPLIIYNWPGGTGLSISPKVVKELSSVENIIGLKNTASLESSNLFMHYTQDEDFDIVTGWETLLLPNLACGCNGGIGVSFNVVPGLCLELYDSFVKQKDIEKAQYLHNKLVPLFEAIFKEPSPGPIKAALEMIGIPVGPTRLPLTPISQALKDEIRNILRDLNVI